MSALAWRSFLLIAVPASLALWGALAGLALLCWNIAGAVT